VIIKISTVKIKIIRYNKKIRRKKIFKRRVIMKMLLLFKKIEREIIKIRRLFKKIGLEKIKIGLSFKKNARYYHPRGWLLNTFSRILFQFG
jgi:hypothetical protein